MIASRASLVVSLAAAIGLVAHPAVAQVRASERGSVSQTVDGTVITVDYGRPQARGRDSLFGRVVTRDEIWTPGANYATTFQVSRDVTVAGKPVPAGKYSLWLASDPASEWTLYFHKDTALWHTAHPKPSTMFLAVPIPHTMAGEHVEVLTFDFPRVSPMHTELRLRWGKTTVPIAIDITPSAPRIVMTDEQLAPYVGTYDVIMRGPNGDTLPKVKLAIVNAKGMLRGVVDQPGAPMALEYLPMKTPHFFMPAFVKDGKVVDTEVLPIEFKVVDGRAVGFVAYGLDEKPRMEGKRKN
jgi:hypothetical protein